MLSERSSLRYAAQPAFSLRYAEQPALCYAAFRAEQPALCYAAFRAEQAALCGAGCAMRSNFRARASTPPNA
jgi:hypothetical protein